MAPAPLAPPCVLQVLLSSFGDVDPALLQLRRAPVFRCVSVPRAKYTGACRALPLAQCCRRHACAPSGPSSTRTPAPGEPARGGRPRRRPRSPRRPPKQPSQQASPKQQPDTARRQLATRMPVKPVRGHS
jgi:hypothetical protein